MKINIDDLLDKATVEKADRKDTSLYRIDFHSQGYPISVDVEADSKAEAIKKAKSSLETQIESGPLWADMSKKKSKKA